MNTLQSFTLADIIANLYMEELEVLAIEKARTPPKFCKRYVDDCFAILKKHAAHTFHLLLNMKNRG